MDSIKKMMGRRNMSSTIYRDAFAKKGSMEGKDMFGDSFEEKESPKKRETPLPKHMGGKTQPKEKKQPQEKKQPAETKPKTAEDNSSYGWHKRLYKEKLNNDESSKRHKEWEGHRDSWNKNRKEQFDKEDMQYALNPPRYGWQNDLAKKRNDQMMQDIGPEPDNSMESAQSDAYDAYLDGISSGSGDYDDSWLGSWDNNSEYEPYDTIGDWFHNSDTAKGIQSRFADKDWDWNRISGRPQLDENWQDLDDEEESRAIDNYVTPLDSTYDEETGNEVPHVSVDEGYYAPRYSDRIKAAQREWDSRDKSRDIPDDVMDELNFAWGNDKKLADAARARRDLNMTERTGFEKSASETFKPMALMMAIKKGYVDPGALDVGDEYPFPEEEAPELPDERYEDTDLVNPEDDPMNAPGDRMAMPAFTPGGDYPNGPGDTSGLGTPLPDEEIGPDPDNPAGSMIGSEEDIPEQTPADVEGDFADDVPPEDAEVVPEDTEAVDEEDLGEGEDNEQEEDEDPDDAPEEDEEDDEKVEKSIREQRLEKRFAKLGTPISEMMESFQKKEAGACAKYMTLPKANSSEGEKHAMPKSKYKAANLYKEHESSSSRKLTKVPDDEEGK